MERLTGTVTRTNDTGFQLAGREGWLNVSKFAEGVAVPPAGASVAVDLDGKGFVRKVEMAVSTIVDTAAAAETGTIVPTRETTITRLAVLNTAATILGAGPGYPIDPAEVAKLAARLEAWATRATS